MELKTASSSTTKLILNHEFFKVFHVLFHSMLCYCNKNLINWLSVALNQSIISFLSEDDRLVLTWLITFSRYDISNSMPVHKFISNIIQTNWSLQFLNHYFDLLLKFHVVSFVRTWADLRWREISFWKICSSWFWVFCEEDKLEFNVHQHQIPKSIKNSKFIHTTYQSERNSRSMWDENRSRMLHCGQFERSLSFESWKFLQLTLRQNFKVL